MNWDCKGVSNQALPADLQANDFSDELWFTHTGGRGEQKVKKCEELRNEGRKEDINKRTRYISAAGPVAMGNLTTCRND